LTIESISSIKNLADIYQIFYVNVDWRDKMNIKLKDIKIKDFEKYKNIALQLKK
jgi:hypothetical protein